jgi:hypothetical protein
MTETQDVEMKDPRPPTATQDTEMENASDSNGQSEEDKETRTMTQ